MNCNKLGSVKIVYVDGNGSRGSLHTVHSYRSLIRLPMSVDTQYNITVSVTNDAGLVSPFISVLYQTIQAGQCLSGDVLV